MDMDFIAYQNRILERLFLGHLDAVQEWIVLLWSCCDEPDRYQDFPPEVDPPY